MLRLLYDGHFSRWWIIAGVRGTHGTSEKGFGALGLMKSVAVGSPSN